MRLQGLRRGLSYAACGLMLAGLSACSPSSLEFDTLAQARGAGVFEQAWLPDVLPPSAGLIRIAPQPDGEAEGWFHFSSAEYPQLAARLVPLAKLPEDPAVQTFVKRKGLAGYTAFEQRNTKASWLLLCAENKGRCYFRRQPVQGK